LGILKPADLNADRSLPCDSLIDESQRPITENVGIPGDIDTSIRATVVSVPDAKHDQSLATFGFDGIIIFLLFNQDMLLRSVLSLQKHRRKPTG